jgi:osmotically-inducible protein OsmY
MTNPSSIVVIASLALLLAACDGHPGLEPEVAQQIAAARIDPDAGLARKVEKALGVDTGALPYGVEVTATDGNVELWGTVDSTAARKRFELIAAGVVGVRAVENHIHVDPGA